MYKYIVLFWLMSSISYASNIREKIAAINLQFPGEENRELRRQLIKSELQIRKENNKNTAREYAQQRKKERIKRINQRRKPTQYHFWYVQPYYRYQPRYYNPYYNSRTRRVYSYGVHSYVPY